MPDPTPKNSPPPAARPAMSGSWLAAQGRLPLAFMGLGLIWLVAATALLGWAPESLALPHAHPHVVALTHAWVLGVFVTVACGAVYQLAPVALGTTLASERYGWWHLGLHAFGVPGMVWSFWCWDLKELGHFGFATALGILLFAVNTWRTVRRSGRRGAVAWSLLLAAGWLLVTVLLGLLLAANRWWNFIPIDPVALLRAHAHVGLAGFFLTLLQGVGFQLVPMFTLGEVRDWRLANTGLWLSQGGLLVLAPALAWHLGLLAQVAAVSITAGMVCSGVGLARALASRKKRALDPGLKTFLRGGACLIASAVVGVAVLLGEGDGSQPGGLRGMFYAVLIIFGGLLPCFAGMMCKIVPFLTWMRAYGPRVGRGPTPSASTLANARLERWGLALLGLATIPLLVGVWTLQPLWLRAGVWLLAVGVALFVADMLIVLRHLWLAAAAKPVEVKSSP
ncbi:MAG: hypothetical protein IT582_00470 [Opitutaceae bacterium]|nr:hypothetical protein [Opitutaceae bacterium]